MILSQEWVDKLSKLPETGMGYQIVDVYLKNGVVIRNAIVANCIILINSGIKRLSENDIQDIKVHK